MNSKPIEAMVYLDRTAFRKVIVIPSRIDLPLGTHEIVWRLADPAEQKIVSVKLNCDKIKPDDTSHTDDTWTMMLTNNFEDEGAVLDYVITLEHCGKKYTNEPRSDPFDCSTPKDDGCHPNDPVPVAASIKDSIHNYPV